MLRGMKLSIQFTVSFSLAIAILGGCMTVQKLDSSLAIKYEGFTHDGKTTKQEVQDRLGRPSSIYEDGRIIVYHVYLKKDERLSLQAEGACYACILVFDKDNILERHSLVKHGCIKREQ